MKHILVPIGTSKNSVNTLQYAVDLASKFGSDIYVMQAFTLISKAGSMASIEQKVVETSHRQLEEVIAGVDRKGVKIKVATYNGSPVDGVKAIDKEFGIDLIVLEPKSNDIREEVFLGSTSGSIVKRTNIPALIVPEGNTFKNYKSALVAFKSGIVRNKTLLNPLRDMKEMFGLTLNLLLVKTPNYSQNDLRVDPALMDLSSNIQITENTTTFEGVLEHFQQHNPEILVVFRRKRGFFAKLWEKNIILKREFRCSIPLLVLSVKKY
ncbi:universal stress protein [Robertkochia solimangrovi]|uniref:universal stress protein n=1 Tax=Robertkochia solimangrovi TaxID=2213046 RepID=UPI00117D9938|nr:universal stress protein [Robertkochia solimangrovi]TRZ46146.1 universal stress protein [Robertkochia solimangrovi]